MNELMTPDTQATQAPMLANPNQLMLDDSLFTKCERLANIMASGSCTIPKHLQGKVGDCFAIIGQALRWGMDPYAVAQKTHLVNGVLGYEAQLIIAVINAKAPIVGRLKFENYGDWSKVKTKNDSPSDVGVRVSAIMRGDEQPTILELSMAQVGRVRNSPLWEADPRQQLAYLAAKRWARLHCPDVVLGLYSADELDVRHEEPKNITPTKKNSGTQSLKERAKEKLVQNQETAPVSAEYYDISDLIEKIHQIDAIQKIAPIGREIADMIESRNIHFRDEDVAKLRQELKNKKTEFEYQNLIASAKSANPSNAKQLESVFEAKRVEIGDDKTDTLLAILRETMRS